MRHQELLVEIRKFSVRDPEVQRLRDQAAAALDADPPDHDTARQRLSEGRELVRSKRQAAASLLADQQREEAQLVRGQAQIETSRLRFADAAELFEEAASLWPDDDVKERYKDLISSADGWHEEGRDFGVNDALIESIRVHQIALDIRPRTTAPLDWATTQNNLGTALTSLGERESSTARLEEAMRAYEAALEERTRERVPLDWAATQNNLGTALTSLGQRESSTARLEE
ncbi:MAG: tetratricopeptide repeat protein, partial [bacterium]|nr:tetratricopeptide repeat protein [bacterium]